MTDPMWLSALSAHDIDWQPEPVPLTTRLVARLSATRYDRMLAADDVVPGGTGLELHVRRLTSITERESVARAFRRSLREASEPPSPWMARSWVHRPNVVAAEELIDAVTLWLHSPRPVSTRGMALLRLLLSDGTGPLYSPGRRGDLSRRLRSALAAL